MSAGLPQPAVLSTAQPTSGVAIPVIGAISGAVGSGPAQPVYLVTDADVAAGRFRVSAQAPVPMTIVSGRQALAGNAIPVYVVRGTLLTYAQRLIAIAPQNLIAYWPLSEQSGSVIGDQSGNGHNGSYSNVTLGAPGIGDGGTGATLNGSTSVGNLYSASLAGAFNPLAGSVSLWFRVSAAGVWTDSTIRRMLTLQADGNNRVLLQRSAGNNQVVAMYVAGGTTKSVTVTTAAQLTWAHFGITWNKAADRVRIYYNGSPSGALQTSLGTWAGALASTATVLGSSGTTPGSVWSGDLAQIALWNSELTQGQMAQAATVMPA